MKKQSLAMLVLPLGMAAAAVAYSHNAICSCFDNGDESITCEGGFSDGGKATGVPLRVMDQAGKILVDGVMGKDSSFTFPKPKVPYRVEFNAGEGHVVTIDGRDIEK